VRQYLKALDGEALAEVLPKHVSLTDPQARRTGAPGGPTLFAYSANNLIDTGHSVIVDAHGIDCPIAPYVVRQTGYGLYRVVLFKVDAFGTEFSSSIQPVL
jgi:hypothetical protein